MEAGTIIAFALGNLQERSTLFVSPGESVYEGMIVGENSRPGDMDVNPTKEKKLSNMRSKATDDNITLEPPRVLTLEVALEYIEDDELIEVTPKSIRLRKRKLAVSDRKKISAKPRRSARRCRVWLESFVGLRSSVFRSSVFGLFLTQSERSYYVGQW
jgi:GTP-binding protein